MTGRWTHLAAVYYGRQLRLYQDGKLVAEKEGPVQADIWPGKLYVGQYSGQPAPSYQAKARVAHLQLYHRPLADSEVRQLASSPPETDLRNHP